ncbi:YbaK/EbsC family protein [Candidatus Bipolaricaulota bacterium]
MPTRGIQALRELGIEHEVLIYRYVKTGAQIAAEAVGQPPEIVLKSLVFRADDGSFLFALIGSDTSVSTRKLGRATGHRHVDAAAPRDAQRVTGYLVGGISPLGARQRLTVVLDRETARHSTLVINAGARGTLVQLATEDLIRATEARLADMRT